MNLYRTDLKQVSDLNTLLSLIATSADVSQLNSIFRGLSRTTSSLQRVVLYSTSNLMSYPLVGSVHLMIGLDVSTEVKLLLGDADEYSQIRFVCTSRNINLYNNFNSKFRF